MKQKLLFVTVTALLLCVAIAASTAPALYPRVWQHTQSAPATCVGHDSERFCSALPILSITTDHGEPIVTEDPATGSAISEDVYASIAVRGGNPQNSHLNDLPALTSRIRLRCRGNSSLLFDKKSFQLHLLEEDLQTENAQPLLGMPVHSEWALNGPYLDKTLLRNYLCMNIAGEVSPDTPELRFCELFVDGDYRGVYLAMETVARGEGRLYLPENKIGLPSYLLRADRNKAQPGRVDTFLDYSLRMPTGTTMEILYPSPAQLTAEQRTFIEQDFSAYEKALYSFDYIDNRYGYTAQTEPQSYIDYFILNEFFENADAGQFSTYFYRPIGGKIRIGPVWDFNNACDNYAETAHDGNNFVMLAKPHYYMLTKDPRFTEAVIQRYRWLRQNCLREDYLFERIDQSIAFLGDAVDRNYTVWGYSFDPATLSPSQKLLPDSRNPQNYSSAVAQLKEAIHRRGEWLDQNIELLRQHSHPSKIKKFLH